MSRDHAFRFPLISLAARDRTSRVQRQTKAEQVAGRIQSTGTRPSVHHDGQARTSVVTTNNVQRQSGTRQCRCRYSCEVKTTHPCQNQLHRLWRCSGLWSSSCAWNSHSVPRSHWWRSAAVRFERGPRNAHSHTIATRHPVASRSFLTRRSRMTLALNFARQKSARVDGSLALGHPSCRCQKQPCTKQTAPNRRNIRSSIPERSRA